MRTARSAPHDAGAPFAGTVAALAGVEDEQELRRLTARLGGIASALSPQGRLALRAGASVLELSARLLTGRRLGDLDPEHREAVCAVLTARSSGARLVDALKLPVLMAASTDRLFPENGPEATGAGGAGGAARPGGATGAGAAVETLGMRDGAPDPWLNCVPSADRPACTTADAVVVGSGAGGAMVARTLARAGLSVVIVEEGRRHTSAEFRARPPLDRFLELYRDGGSTVALGSPPVLLPEGRGVGGTTLINSGTCYRTPERVLRRWAGQGVDVARFGEHLDEVERILRVAPQPAEAIGRNGMIALEGARRLGWHAAPLRRNAPGCAGTGECAAGCPRNAKNGVHLNALPEACAAGAVIVTEAWTERVLLDRCKGGPGRAAGIRALRPDGSALEILAPLVVVAAGAVQTPLLLRRSGLGGHPWLGRGLAVHPATNLAGRFDEPVVSWSGVMQSVGIEEHHDDGILIEATAAPAGMGSFVLPGVGRALRAELGRSDHLAVIGAMIADAPSGRVHGHRRALVRYDLAPADSARLRRALVAMGEVLFAAGAAEVLTGFSHRPSARTPGELARIVAAVPDLELHLAGFHPTGTAALGADPARHPVDERGRLRGTRGLYVADASVLPTCPEVNPQLSIMAMALQIAGHVLEDEVAASAGALPAGAFTL